MNSNHIQERLKQIQTYIDDFKKELAESEDHYQESLKLITDPEVCSSLMEQHVIHIEGQKEALAKMMILFDQVQNELAGSGTSN